MRSRSTQPNSNRNESKLNLSVTELNVSVTECFSHEDERNVFQTETPMKEVASPPRRMPGRNRSYCLVPAESHLCRSKRPGLGRLQGEESFESGRTRFKGSKALLLAARLLLFNIDLCYFKIND